LLVFLRIYLLGILIFKGLTARRLYKSFGVKGLSIIKSYILPTQCIYVLGVVLRKLAATSYYGSNVWGFITHDESVYCAVRNGHLSIIHANNSLYKVTVNEYEGPFT
jgi:hypothetical protein